MFPIICADRDVPHTAACEKLEQLTGGPVIITGNGGALFDPVNRRDIMSMDFTDAKARELLRLMIENKVNAVLCSLGFILSPSNPLLSALNK